MNTLAVIQLVKEDGSVHGRIVYSWGECPYCTTYCKFHVQWILDQGWDIIPDHIDVIIQRWENYTGKKAILVS